MRLCKDNGKAEYVVKREREKEVRQNEQFVGHRKHSHIAKPTRAPVLTCESRLITTGPLGAAAMAAEGVAAAVDVDAVGALAAAVVTGLGAAAAAATGLDGPPRPAN